MCDRVLPGGRPSGKICRVYILTYTSNRRVERAGALRPGPDAGGWTATYQCQSGLRHLAGCVLKINTAALYPLYSIHTLAAVRDFLLQRQVSRYFTSCIQCHTHTVTDAVQAYTDRDTCPRRQMFATRLCTTIL